MPVLSSLKRLYWRHWRIPVWAQDGVYHLACLTITAYIVLLLMAVASYLFEETLCSMGGSLNVDWMRDNCRYGSNFGRFNRYRSDCVQENNVDAILAALPTITVPTLLYVLFYHLVLKAQREGSTDIAAEASGDKKAEGASKALVALKRLYWRYCRLPGWAQNGLYHFACLTIAAYIGVLIATLVAYLFFATLCAISEAGVTGMSGTCWDTDSQWRVVRHSLKVALRNGMPALLYVLFYQLVAKEQQSDEKDEELAVGSGEQKRAKTTNSKDHVLPMAFA